MTVHQNTGFGTHNTTARGGRIEYIVVHYVGGTGDARANVSYYNQPGSTRASADFYVGHKGDIWQYNPDPKKRYCWAVGGAKYANGGGRLFGKATNRNCISVELCCKLRGKKTAAANDLAWYIEEATVAAAAELVRGLMAKYKIPIERVIRHFDVNGKPCPGVVGWNPLTGSEEKWKDFLERVKGDDDGMSYDQFKAFMLQYEAEKAKEAATWEKVVMTEAKSKGIMDGTRPKSNITRGEVAQVLKNAGLLK